ncbi:helix-turn-helix domain-containing protein [Plectonema radiosum]|nr:helix-turn-helix domain-containing protein [Plectonema radiosum]
MSSMYSLSVPGQPAIEISQDELRSLLSEIETELHNSKVYRRALATVQKLLGPSSEQAKLLFKAVGREAIGVAFRQLSLHNQTITDTTPEVEEKIEPKIETSPVQSTNDLSECLTIVSGTPPLQAGAVGRSPVNPSPTTSIVKEQPSKPTTVVDSSKNTTAFNWFKSGKPSKAEIAKQTRVEQRLEKFREIGQQLKQARESRGFCLSDLHMYTHIPIHQMEAVERGDMESLPADVYVRGFIRVMGNALGFNGTVLAASLPTSETKEALVPSLFESDNKIPRIGLDISPMHLYVGYTALVAGAVGGLSIISQQQSNAEKAINTEVTPASEVSESFKYKENTAKPGIKSSNAGITIGSDIAPPEAL